MEILVFLLGNLCCSAAGALLLYQVLGQGMDASRDLHISADLQYMLCLGSIARVYWSLSPPEIWSEEPYLTQWTCVIDLTAGALVWTMCAVLSIPQVDAWLATIRQQRRKKMDDDFILDEHTLVKKPEKMNPLYHNWAFLTAGCAVGAYLATHLLPSLAVEGAWPLVDWAVVFNMLVDGLAMVPQCALIASRQDKTPQFCSHFVGLLCTARVLRMLFWVWLVLHPQSGHALWTFVIPDLVHTIALADFLCMFLRKIKDDSVDIYNSFTSPVVQV
ncbi:unnamed protein product [Amoebophrya sp. A25]|nr:unnamed protein product [Amoebophrya sp. A25]|eukprot:GSA25T00011363001.1